MQTSNDLIDVATLIGFSGQFLRMGQDGRLITVSSLLLERAKVADDLTQVEWTLLDCNNPVALAQFAVWCMKKKKEFGSELPKKVRALETRKSQLQAKLRDIDAQLPEENADLDWTTSFEPFVGLVPRIVARSDPSIAVRNNIIDQNLHHPHIKIVKALDFQLKRNGQVPPEYFPNNWSEKHGVYSFTDAYRDPKCRPLVHKMISIRKQKQHRDFRR